MAGATAPARSSASAVLSMQSAGLPPEAMGAAAATGALGSAYLALRLAAELVRFRSERRKLDAERDTAELVGEKAIAEARTAGVLELAAVVGQLRLDLQDMRAELLTEQERSRAFRSAVGELIGTISSVLPQMPPAARMRVQAALDKLRLVSGW